MDKQRLLVRWVGRVGMAIPRWIKAVLQHSSAAKVLSWIAVAQQGKPARRRCVCYTKNQECVAAVSVLVRGLPNEYRAVVALALKFPAYNVSLSPPLNQKSPSSAMY